MNKVFFVFVLFVYSFSFAQDNYKYVILPKKFSFFKEENKFGLNELTKSFFEKEGFEVFFDSDYLPPNLYQNRCIALFVVPVENNTIFLTRIYFEVKDCRNNILLTSEVATSREKLLKTAYFQTFRQALLSLKNKINFKTENTIQNVDVIATTKDVVTEAKNEITLTTEITSSLFAIPTTNGYKLVNDKPETIFILMKTSSETIFTAQKGLKSGVLIKKMDNWFFEYYEGEKLLSEKVEIKF